MHYQLKITLKNVKPTIWRRVLVPSVLTLFDLHHVIQIVMGWSNYHLHDFTIKKQRYAVPSREDFDDPIDERESRLCDVAGLRGKINYQYDFGDGWEHVIVVEKVVDDEAIPRSVCIGGARACPPEDSGGPWGYEEKLRALSNGDDDDESRELREWIGENFDPESFDKDSVNDELQKFFRPIRNRRRPD